MQPHQDILRVVAETPAEDIEATGMRRGLVDADAQADRMMPVKGQRGDGGGRQAFAVEIGAARRYQPGGQRAVLRPGELPPARRVAATLVAEVAGRGPRPDPDVVH